MTEHKSIQSVQLKRTTSELEIVKSDNPVTAYRTYSASEAAAIERRLVRKLDTRILPLIVLIYVLNYVSIMLSSFLHNLLIFSA